MREYYIFGLVEGEKGRDFGETHKFSLLPHQNTKIFGQNYPHFLFTFYFFGDDDEHDTNTHNLFFIFTFYYYYYYFYFLLGMNFPL